MVGNLPQRQLPQGLLLLKSWGALVGAVCALTGAVLGGALGGAFFYAGAGLIVAATAVRITNVLLGNEPLIRSEVRRNRRGPNITKY